MSRPTSTRAPQFMGAPRSVQTTTPSFAVNENHFRPMLEPVARNEAVAPPPSPPAQPVIVPTPAPAIQALENAVEALRLRGEQLAEQARADALEIGFLVARRILEQELTVSPQPLFALIRSAVRRLGETRPVTVRLHPTDHARLAALDENARREALSLVQVVLVADAELTPGDCVVTSEQGTVDGRINTRLAELGRAVEGLLGKDAP